MVLLNKTVFFGCTALALADGTENNGELLSSVKMKIRNENNGGGSNVYVNVLMDSNESLCSTTKKDVTQNETQTWVSKELGNCTNVIINGTVVRFQLRSDDGDNYAPENVIFETKNELQYKWTIKGLKTINGKKWTLFDNWNCWEGSSWFTEYSQDSPYPCNLNAYTTTPGSKCSRTDAKHCFSDTTCRQNGTFLKCAHGTDRQCNGRCVKNIKENYPCGNNNATTCDAGTTCRNNSTHLNLKCAQGTDRQRQCNGLCVKNIKENDPCGNNNATTCEAGTTCRNNSTSNCAQGTEKTCNGRCVNDLSITSPSRPLAPSPTITSRPTTTATSPLAPTTHDGTSIEVDEKQETTKTVPPWVIAVIVVGVVFVGLIVGLCVWHKKFRKGENNPHKDGTNAVKKDQSPAADPDV